MQSWQQDEPIADLNAGPTRVDAGCRFKDALEIRYQTGYAVLVTGKDGETRVIGDSELYRGLLGVAA